MHARPPGRRAAGFFAGSVVLVLTGWNTAVVPRFPAGWYAPVHLTATVALLAVARRSGLSWAQLGLARGRARAGLRWAAGPVAAVAAGYAAAVTVPALRPLLADARVAGLGRADVARQVLVRIPVGTVLWEEVAFRGVLHAALARVLPPRAAVLVGAGVFGLWHLRPTREALAANDLVRTPVRTALAVGAGCLVTAVGGLGFTESRLRSGSLLAPVLVHLATNDLGLVAAVVATGAER